MRSTVKSAVLFAATSVLLVGCAHWRAAHRQAAAPVAAPVVVQAAQTQSVAIPELVLHYDTDVMNFTPEEDAALNRISNLLMLSRSTRIYVDGYADARRVIDGNVELARDRAHDVAFYLEGEGVRPDQMTVRSFGAKHPVASNRTATGRARNRRVVVHQAS